MAVWGIGSKYKVSKNADKTKDFISQGVACIGYKEKEAPALYQMMKTIKIGDIIYIKAFAPSKKCLIIKAVGMVTEKCKNRGYLGYGVKVKWIESFEEPIKVEVFSPMYKNNVFNNSLYEEYNEKVISKLIDKIMG